jgi:hypothetical protein
MLRYQFIVKETPQGKAHHSDPRPHSHLDRRELSRQKGHIIGVERVGDVEEAYVDGFGYYTWVVDAPSVAAVIALMQECVRHGFVELHSGPVPELTDKERSDIDVFSHQMRTAFPDK